MNISTVNRAKKRADKTHVCVIQTREVFNSKRLLAFHQVEILEVVQVDPRDLSHHRSKQNIYLI